jgi:hypothetical protein
VVPTDKYMSNAFSHSKHIIFRWEAGDQFDT